MTWPELDRIDSDRCVLEPLDPGHADAMVGVLSAPELYEFTGGEPPQLADLRARYEFQSKAHSPDHRQWWCNWVVLPRGDERPVGYVQATVEKTAGTSVADIAWVIGLADQGKGWATEAATAMIGWLRDHGVRDVVAHIHPDHAASAAVARKLGLHPTSQRQDDEIRWELRG